jgi:hypothetical protein
MARGERDAPHYRFVTNCIGSDSVSIRDMIETEKDISLATFRRRIGPEQWKEIQANLGYDRHFPISKDWHIGYYESVYQGAPAVFLRHSGVEWIFVAAGAGAGAGAEPIAIPTLGSIRSGVWWKR